MEVPAWSVSLIYTRSVSSIYSINNFRPTNDDPDISSFSTESVKLRQSAHGSNQYRLRIRNGGTLRVPLTGVFLYQPVLQLESLSLVCLNSSGEGADGTRFKKGGYRVGRVAGSEFRLSVRNAIMACVRKYSVATFELQHAI